MSSQARSGPRRVLVLGGARSGKSTAAERMLAGAGLVDYIATGAPQGTDDADWDQRIAAHRERRPAAWRTIETIDLEPVLAGSGVARPALIDCFATWLARTMDDCGLWDGKPDAEDDLRQRTGALISAWRGSRRLVVAVSNEVGSGVVPGTPSGLRFRDELGQLNIAIAEHADEVWFCVAGIPQRLK